MPLSREGSARARINSPLAYRTSPCVVLEIPAASAGLFFADFLWISKESQSPVGESPDDFVRFYWHYLRVLRGLIQNVLK